MQTTEPEMMSEDRNDVRALIFRAARSLAESGGAESVTLGKVATEAQLPRPAVYGQFVRKEDLVLCVAADSVAILARRMGGIDWTHNEPKFDENRECATILTLPRTELEPETPQKMIELAREVSLSLRTSSHDSTSFGSRGSARGTERTRVAATQTYSVPKDEAAAEGRIDDFAASMTAAPTDRPAIHSPSDWMERRLLVFERTMAELKDRQEQIEKKSRAVASAESRIGDVLDKVSQLVARVDESETRQKDAANDIRLALKEANVRIQTVEGVARAALVENGSVPTIDAHTVLPPMPESPVSVDQNEPKEALPIEPPNGLQRSFRATAREAINSAEASKVEIIPPRKIPEPENHTRHILAGLVVAAVFVAAAGVAFSQGVKDGRSEALQHLALATPSRAMVSNAGGTPLDRLTGRAEAGDADAELSVASKYLNNSKTTRDPAAGFRWMTRAAVHGNAVAQYLLGTLYQQGIGTAANAVQSMHWYEAAALQGNRKAMHNLAIAYAEGLSGVKNPSEAARWLSRAANLGYVDSQFDLAVLYERGDGVPQSLLDAYKWYAIAGAQGDGESKSRIDALRTQLSADDVAAAQHAADSFRALPYNSAANLPPKG